MVAAFLLLLAASTPGSTSDFANRILSIEERTGARIGVAALDTGSGKRLDYRSKERFPMCSTFQFLAAAAVLKRVDDEQQKLERFVTYGAKDILEHAPVTKEHLKDGGMTLGALCAAGNRTERQHGWQPIAGYNWRTGWADKFRARYWR